MSYYKNWQRERAFFGDPKFRFKKDLWLSPNRFKDYNYKNEEYSWEVLKLPGSGIVDSKTADARSWRMPSIPLPSPNYSTGRHTPYYTHPDIRIYELNRRLQQRTEESDNLWWDSFVTEFFEEDATLTLNFCQEDGPKRYTIGRTLIPRYFRSIFEGGVTELYYHLLQPKESYHNTTITLDCENTTMVTSHIKPFYTKVCTEGRLILEFTFDDIMRIRNWHFTVQQHREMVPRNLVVMQEPGMIEQVAKNVTRNGMTNFTLNYLRLCVILEPMQELMSRHKTYNMSPRDCLKSTLFQRWQRMCAPPEYQAEMMWPPTATTPGTPTKETSRPTRTRRKRKSSSTPNASTPTSSGNSTSKKKSPTAANFTLASQDVMVVGEPSLMGGEFGDEDERLITRLTDL
ncbi:LIM domain-binding protein 2-like isoform X2 [Actinia tenebrosa]|uniref:LIM domain-binding protein 2-like isoform X2 n=1 Tax=Actinia tenebrosa TaxID=6105 RepID=A0A6P8IRD6_ACTTE|nr:LIM domain-binding protein 2-like isoform X2 [Actinia tenebrosa]